MDGEDIRAHRRIRQVDEEQLVEPALAHQLRRQAVDGVRGGNHEHRRLALGHPGQQSAEHTLTDAFVVVAGRQAFLQFVHPQHAGRHLLSQLERLTQVALGLAEELVVQATEIQTQQRQPPQACHRLGRQALAAALHANQQHALGHVRAFAIEEDVLALAQPALEVA